MQSQIKLAAGGKKTVINTLKVMERKNEKKKLAME